MKRTHILTVFVLVALLLILLAKREAPRRSPPQGRPEESIPAPPRAKRNPTPEVTKADPTASVHPDTEVVVRVVDEFGAPVAGVRVSLVPPTEAPLEKVWPQLVAGRRVPWLPSFAKVLAELAPNGFERNAVSDGEGRATWQHVPAEFEYRYLVHRDVRSLQPPPDTPVSPFRESENRITLDANGYLPPSMSGPFWVSKIDGGRLEASIWNRTSVRGVFLAPGDSLRRRGTLYEVARGRLSGLRRVELAGDGSFTILGLEAHRNYQLQFIAVSGSHEHGWKIQLAQASFQCITGKQLDLGRIKPIEGRERQGMISVRGLRPDATLPIALRVFEAAPTREGIHSLIEVELPRAAEAISLTLCGLSAHNAIVLDAAVDRQAVPPPYRIRSAYARLHDELEFDLVLNAGRIDPVSFRVEAPLAPLFASMSLFRNGQQVDTCQLFVEHQAQSATGRLRASSDQTYRLFAHTTHPFNKSGESYYVDQPYGDQHNGPLQLRLLEGVTVEVQAVTGAAKTVRTLRVADSAGDFDNAATIHVRPTEDRWVFYGVPPGRSFRFAGSDRTFETGLAGTRVGLLDSDL